MSNPEQALATQLRNIEAKTGQDLAALRAAVAASGKVKHGEVRTWVMETYGLGHGDANTLAHFAAGGKGLGDAPGEADATLSPTSTRAGRRTCAPSTKP